MDQQRILQLAQPSHGDAATPAATQPHVAVRSERERLIQTLCCGYVGGRRATGMAVAGSKPATDHERHAVIEPVQGVACATATQPMPTLTPAGPTCAGGSAA